MDKAEKIKFIAENTYPKGDGNTYDYDYDCIIEDLDKQRLWNDLGRAERQTKAWNLFEKSVEDNTFVLSEDESGSKYVRINSGQGKASG